MKKLFALLLLCAFGSIAISAQSDQSDAAVTPSYRFVETETTEDEKTLKTLTIHGTGDLTGFTEDGKTFADILKEKIIASSFTTVKFKNEGAKTSEGAIIDTLFVNDDIVRSILFAHGEWQNDNNGKIVTLDLGEATVKKLTCSTFMYSETSTARGQMVNLVLPLTKLSEVKSETIEGVVSTKKMVVPSNVLEKFTYGNLRTVTIPEGYQWVGNNAFNGIGILETVTLPSTLTVINDSAFYNCTKLDSIILNDGLENIGKDAFCNCSKLTKMNFPSTLRIINDGAFWECKIVDLKFNTGLYFIGNGAFGLDGWDEGDGMNNMKTLEIPASVRYIGPGAFHFREYQDVYFYGKDAPLMPMGKINNLPNSNEYNTAFPANSLMGYNGFSPKDNDNMTVENMADDTSKGYANRENYRNGHTYICILHYPKGLTDEQRAKYTDITRVYKTNRKDGEFDKGPYTVGEEENTLSWFVADSDTQAGKDVGYGYEDTYLGSQYVWPSHGQWMRSYIVNSNGYNWDGVTSYPVSDDEDYWLDNDIATLAYAGYVIGDEEGQYTEEELRKIAHMGTRQFVLTNADVNGRERAAIGEDEQDPEPDLTMEGEEWWTICVPFDMTKEQVDEVFGAGTHVCRFSSVERKDNEGSKSVVLKFQNDVYATKWERDPETLLYTKQEGVTPDEQDIVIYSREAYMIYPTKTEEININFEDYENGVGSPLATLIKANNGEGADTTEYRFVGTYLTEVNSYDGKTSSTVSIKIPKYSYMYAHKNGDNGEDGKPLRRFWFLTGENMPWSANRCVVQVSDRTARENEFFDFFGGDGNNSKVEQSSLFGEDNSATAIENITIIAGEGKDAQVVYSINGQKVRNDGTLDGLGKGVYIRGGKKFVVK